MTTSLSNSFINRKLSAFLADKLHSAFHWNHITVSDWWKWEDIRDSKYVLEGPFFKAEENKTKITLCEMHESLTLQFPEVDLQLYFYYNGRRETSTALLTFNIQKIISRMNEKSYK